MRTNIYTAAVSLANPARNSNALPLLLKFDIPIKFSSGAPHQSDKNHSKRAYIYIRTGQIYNS